MTPTKRREKMFNELTGDIIMNGHLSIPVVMSTNESRIFNIEVGLANDVEWCNLEETWSCFNTATSTWNSKLSSEHIKTSAAVYICALVQ